MTADELKAIINDALPFLNCELDDDGRHWQATIVSDAFEGKRAIVRHQMVCATLGARIQNDEVHALSMKTMTGAEWKNNG